MPLISDALVKRYPEHWIYEGRVRQSVDADGLLTKVPVFRWPPVTALDAPCGDAWLDFDRVSFCSALWSNIRWREQGDTVED